MAFEMAVSLKITDSAIGNKYDALGLDLQGKQSLEEFLQFLKYSLKFIALDALREEQGKGFDKTPIMVIDGSTRKNIDDVKPFGKIQFINSKLNSLEVLESIYVEILIRSRMVSGTYIKGNFVYFNDRVVATNYTELRQWIKSSPKITSGDIIRFVNVVPYARKLERHGISQSGNNRRKRPKWVKSSDKKKRSGRPATDKKGRSIMQILGANGAYFLASRAALKGFKHNIKIQFKFETGSMLGIQGLEITGPKGKLRRNYKPTKKNPSNSGPYLYPVIKVTIGETGTI